MKNGSAVNNIMSHSSDGVVLKTMAGADIIFQADNFTIQDPTTDSKMLKFNIFIKMNDSETSEMWKSFIEITGIEYNLDYKEGYEVN